VSAVKLLAELAESLGAGPELVAELTRRGLIGKSPNSGEEIRLVLREELARAGQTHVEDGLLTVQEAARYASVTAATIREWIKSGRLLASRAGNRWRVHRKAIEEAMRMPRRRFSEEADVEERAARILSMRDAKPRRR